MSVDNGPTVVNIEALKGLPQVDPDRAPALQPANPNVVVDPAQVPVFDMKVNTQFAGSLDAVTPVSIGEPAVAVSPDMAEFTATFAPDAAQAVEPSVVTPLVRRPKRTPRKAVTQTGSTAATTSTSALPDPTTDPSLLSAIPEPSLYKKHRSAQQPAPTPATQTVDQVRQTIADRLKDAQAKVATPATPTSGDQQPATSGGSLSDRLKRAQQATPAPTQLSLTTALPRLDAGNTPAATPNTAPTPSTPNTMPVEEIERRRDLYMALQSARVEYIDATVAGRVDSTKAVQKRYEAATERYADVRREAIELHAEDMLASGKTLDEVKESITKLFVEDTYENASLVSEAMIQKAVEAQAIIEAAENPDKSTLKGKLIAGKERAYKMWTEGSGEKLLSKAGFKNRWKRSGITAVATFVPGVAIGAVAATIAAPLMGVAGAGALVVATSAAARGALKGATNEFINRRTEKWHQSSSTHPAVTSAEEMRERTVNSNLQLATAYGNNVIDELSSDLLIAQDKQITLDLLEQARAKERQANKELRKKVAVFAGSSVLGVGVGAGIRWVAGHGMEFVSEAADWVRNHNATLPSKTSNTLNHVTSTTSAPTTTVTTHAPTTTIPTTQTTIPTTPSVTIPEAQPAPPVVTDLPSASAPNAKVLAELQTINADPASKAAFDQMVHNPYEFGKLQNYADSIRIQHPEMSPAQIDQMTLDGLSRARTEQIHHYLLGTKALEDQSGLKVGTAEFDQYASNKINQVSAAEFADTKGFIGGRIVNSGLTDLQKDSLYQYANADSLPNFTKAHSILSKTVADYQSAPRPEMNAMIVQNMNTGAGTSRVADLMALGYDEDEIAEMLLTYYGINV